MIQPPLVSVVITSGLIDSFNPCAISLLLIYISLMFTLKKDRKEIATFAIAYIVSIYITYFLIGITGLKILDFMRAASLPIPNLVAKIGAGLVFFFGLMNIKEYFFPNLPFSVRIPLKVRGYVSKYAYEATLTSAIVVGFLIGIYEFPCSGAIYLAIISLLHTQVNFFVGIGYLLLYNLMFVLPLIAIFALTTNKLTTEKFINLQEKHGRKLHLFLALMMLILGVTILWVTK
jgi:cytochrome c-type biogenesis protein